MNPFGITLLLTLVTFVTGHDNGLPTIEPNITSKENDTSYVIPKDLATEKPKITPITVVSTQIEYTDKSITPGYSTSSYSAATNATEYSASTGTDKTTLDNSTIQQSSDENKEIKQEIEYSASTGTDKTTLYNSTIKQSSDENKEIKQEIDQRILLTLLLVPVVLAVAGYIILKFKCKKVHDHAETTDNGLENASFQRSESNKDGVMLLGVKPSGDEGNAAAK
ncbi:uncharacterized protein LOC114794911 isoform X2 [Denticeps clupeoides]|uniref:uncharacterized protein LOC114794911 isoform X2 n=1 Tax=Denticeps clupeoides TaxID=299321 RepID=UPI0010A40D04|nr:uncharacterized protein LOC114794911 isoform X2 [Denticeps clupeoides]